MAREIARRKRPRIGDVVEIVTPKGLAYAQYTHNHKGRPHWGHLIRVLPGLFESRPATFSKLVQEKERFFIFFPLGVAVHRGIMEIVAREDIPARCVSFPLFRVTGLPDREGRVHQWGLWDGTKEWHIGSLAPEHVDLSLLRIVNDTRLVQMIVSGWKPSDDV